MKKVLVILHIYYHEQVDYFIDKLGNITGVDWDLKVTSPNQNEETERKLRAFKPDVEFIYTENYGYDIMPFIKVIKSINLNDYDYIIKLHTKRKVDRTRINKVGLRGYEWRDALVDGILYSNKHFKKIIGIFEKRAEIGMISNLLTYTETTFFEKDNGSSEELKRLNLSIQDKHVCLGTMFICKAEVLSLLQDEKVSLDLFKDHKPKSDSNDSYAHIYERILSLLPSSMGYKHLALATRKRYQYAINFLSVFQIPFKWFFCLERDVKDRRKYCRIMGIKFYLSKHE